MTDQLVYAFSIGVLAGLGLAYLVIPAIVDAWMVVVRRVAPSTAIARRRDR